MKHYFLIVFLLICSNMFAQESDTFSIKIDSINAIKMGYKGETNVLEVYVSITNLSAKTISILSPGSIHKRQVAQGWNLIIKKNDQCVEWSTPSELDSPIYREIDIKKHKSLNIGLLCMLDDMATEDSKSEGKYTATLELTTLRTKDSPRETAESNTVEFEIK